MRTRPKFVPVNYWKLKAPRPYKVRGALLLVGFEVAYQCGVKRFSVPTLYRYVVGLLWIGESEPSVVDSIVKVKSLTEQGDAVFDRLFVEVGNRFNIKGHFTVASVGAVVLLFKKTLSASFSFSHTF